MDTQMHAIHFKADKKLLSFIQERLNKLEQFNDQIVSAEVYLRLDKESEIFIKKINELKNIDNTTISNDYLSWISFSSFFLKCTWLKLATFEF